MPADEAADLLNFAFGQEEEDRLFDRWIQFAQNTMSFDEFKQQLKPPKLPSEDTLKDVANIIDSVAKEQSD